jgi:hypothetical protein
MGHRAAAALVVRAGPLREDGDRQAIHAHAADAASFDEGAGTMSMFPHPLSLFDAEKPGNV